MLNGMFYLTNSGSRWVIIEDGKKIKVKIIPDRFNELPEEIVRTAIEFKSFGNIAAVVYSYKGKKRSTLNYELV